MSYDNHDRTCPNFFYLKGISLNFQKNIITKDRLANTDEQTVGGSDSGPPASNAEGQ